MVISMLGRYFFKYRGLTPIPFYIFCIVSGSFNELLSGVGLSIILIGECLRIWSVGYLGKESRAGTAIASELVINGPFQRVRNPIYLGNILIYAGFAVLSNTFFPWFPAFTIGFFLVAYYFVIIYEEKFLLEKFGAKYTNYLTAVRRFLPNGRPVSPQTIVPFDLQKALRSEGSTFMIMGLGLLFMGVRFFVATM